MIEETAWRTASYSGDNSNCVEVAAGDQVGVRDTKDRGGGQLTVNRRSWVLALSGFEAASRNQRAG